MASDAACAQQFHSMQLMAQQGGRSGLVRLDFINTPDRLALYAHEAYLMSASGVLRDLLTEDEAASGAQGPQSKIARTSDSSDAKAARVRAIIPLHDESVTAWEETLSLLYPSTMFTAKVTWENAERLLLLADRYDMPCITEHVKRFMAAAVPAGASRLQTCITSCEVFKWLTVFSRCALDEQAAICINFIVQRKMQLPADFLSSGLQHKHLEQLYNTMQQHSAQQISNLQQEISRLRGPSVVRGLGNIAFTSDEEDGSSEGENDEDEGESSDEGETDDEGESSGDYETDDEEEVY